MQLLTDGTSWLQSTQQNLFISIVEDNISRPLFLSSPIILESESSAQHCDTVVKMIKRGG